MKITPRLMMIRDFFKFYVKAETVYTQDSPLVYSFCNEVLERFESISIDVTKNYRLRCLSDQTLISKQKLGAPSQVVKTEKVLVTKIAKSASSHLKKCKLLVAIAIWNKAETILELGTNLGFATMSWAEHQFAVETVEGHPQIHEKAKSNLSIFSNVKSHLSTFDDFLKDHKKKYDLIFIDGDHSYEATTLLLQQTKRFLQPDGLIILDDIRWSEDMKKVWAEVIKDTTYNLRFDLFGLGIVTKNAKLKQSISKSLIPKKYKPWPYHFFRK